MPHVIVKMFPGRSDEQKARVAEAITRALMTEANCTEASISIGIEEVTSDDWGEKVFAPDIAAKQATLFKKPGYGTL